MAKLAYVFPGQGSQFIGMLSELAKDYPSIEASFELASAKLGFDVWQLAQTGSESDLNQTQNTQTVMLTADVALFNLLNEHGAKPADYMAGHSLGEYAALVCAGAMRLEDAVSLVSRRGFLMQETVPQGMGAMAAIVGLTDEQVISICEQASSTNSEVCPANFNAIGQVVVAGHIAAVTAAIELAEAASARLAKIIPVSVPCHCPLLKSTALAFEQDLENTSIKAPNCSVISNVDLSSYESPEQIKSLLSQQLYKPVRWVETIQLLKAKGVETIVECGPGKVLAGLIKRIDKNIDVYNVYDKSSLDNLLRNINV